MPTLEQVEDSLSAAFAAAVSPLPVAWGNVEFDTEGIAEWLRFDVQYNGGTNPELNGKSFRRFGILSVQIFVAATTGKRRARQIAETVLATFEGQTIGGVRLRNVGPTDVGVSDAWYQMNVTAQFEFDQIR